VTKSSLTFWILSLSINCPATTNPLLLVVSPGLCSVTSSRISFLPLLTTVCQPILPSFLEQQDCPPVLSWWSQLVWKGSTLLASRWPFPARRQHFIWHLLCHPQLNNRRWILNIKNYFPFPILSLLQSKKNM